MPSNQNTFGNFQIQDTNLNTINDALRRIGVALNSQVTAATNPTASLTSQASLQIAGAITTGANLGTPLTLPNAWQPSKVVLLLGTPPASGTVIVQIYVGGTAWGSPISATGHTTTANASGYPQLPADELITLSVTSAGTGAANLVVQLR